MSFERFRSVLYEPTQAHQLLGSIWRAAKPWLLAGHRLVVTVEQEPLSLTQRQKFYAMCGDFARSGIPWAGSERTKDEWAVLLISGHAIATKHEAEVIRGLEGELVNMRETMSTMPKQRASSLIEYTLAEGPKLGVQFRDHEVTA